MTPSEIATLEHASRSAFSWAPDSVDDRPRVAPARLVLAFVSGLIALLTRVRSVS